MNLSLVLDMLCSGMAGRTAVCAEQSAITYEQLALSSRAAASCFSESRATGVAYVGNNHLVFPIALFGAAIAGVPLVPVNYRLADAQLQAQIDAHPGAYVIHDGGAPECATPVQLVERMEFLGSLDEREPDLEPCEDPDAPALILYTSGTTSHPKAAVLRHRHLFAYLIGTVEFSGADPDEATLVSAPPYHIAGVANLLSNLYAGRRVVYLGQFDPERWLSVVRQERITNAMLIPTMLARIVNHLQGEVAADTPTLRSISYGGARMPLPILRRALELFPTTDFVNAYGLTETTSTVALLGPEDHRSALRSLEPAVQRRLESVGQALPGIDLEIRDGSGEPLLAGEVGFLYVRGDQVAGEYGGASTLDSDGWFSTRDRAWLDVDGYLFIEGRADDTIIRGGENISPAEIEDLLVSHPQLADAVVVGLPDDEWGQRLAAVGVPRDGGPPPDPDDLRQWVRERLRSSKTPESIDLWPELPRTETGKILRREVIARLMA